MITEAIILAGGLGTRLRSVVADLPKSLAPVAGKPFLEYLIDYARSQGIRKFIFALGYRTEQIEAFVKEYLPGSSYVFSVEEEPLGTGGAIYKACSLVTGSSVIILNADTFYGVSFNELEERHEQLQAACTVALKPMRNFDRYGVVDINRENTITGFSEKKQMTKGLINGGVYALRVDAFLQRPFPAAFSFEKEYLEKEYHQEKIAGLISDAYFIDIGIPEDFTRAQKEMPLQVAG